MIKRFSFFIQKLFKKKCAEVHLQINSKPIGRIKIYRRESMIILKNSKKIS